MVAAATGLDAETLRGMLDAPEVTEAYERDRAETRSAAGSAAELQGKTAVTDGKVRFTASSVTFERDGQRLIAGGFQPVAAYDVLIANLDPALDRRPVPDDPAELVAAYPDGLTTQEIAALLARGNDAPDRAAAEQAMLDLVFDGRAERVALGDDAVWLAPDRAEWFRGVLREAEACRPAGGARSDGMNMVLPDPGAPNLEFERPADRERMERTAAALEGRGFRAVVADDGDHARRLVFDELPAGAEVHTALSETLRELGITAEIDESGRYDSVRAKLATYDRETQGREMASLARPRITSSAARTRSPTTA